MESVLLDIAGHRRPPATMPGYNRGPSCRWMTTGGTPSWAVTTHANLGITSVSLEGIDTSEIIDTFTAGRRRQSLPTLASS